MKPTGDSVSRIISSVPEGTIDRSKRDFLRAAMALLAGLNLPRTSLAGGGLHGAGGSGQRVVMVVFGGVRRIETFSPQGLVNIPHLSGDLLPQSLFYRDARNEGVTAHFNAISSILTGNWQRVDDWGKLAPTTPTLFEQFRKGLGAAQSDTWVVASNKALTNLIGASSATDYGPGYGANVVFPKQLMVAAWPTPCARDAAATWRIAKRSRRNCKACWKRATTKAWDGASSTVPSGWIRACAALLKRPSRPLCAAAAQLRATN
ncbi:MAG: hypothetical protein ACHQT6_10040 [Candidatus Acidiferrales bacterium]